MKKIFSFFTGAFFIAALLVNFSSDSNGHLRFFKQANAVLPTTYTPTAMVCFDGDGYICGYGVACLTGSQSKCLAIGCNCPN